MNKNGKIILPNEANVLLKVCRIKDKQRTLVRKKKYKEALLLEDMLTDIAQRKAHIVYTYLARKWKDNNFYS